jgi:hypothetical protein
MEVTINDPSVSRPLAFDSMAACAEYLLRGDRCFDNIGAVETVEQRAEHNSRAIGRLMAVLVKKNILTTAECVDVLQTYMYNDKE